MTNLIFKKTSTVCCIFATAVFLVSCSQSSDNNKEANAPEFNVRVLDTSTVTTYTEFSTTMQSQNVVEIRPRVTGYIESIPKKEGSFVRKGDVIFQISNDDYKQQVNVAKASVNSAEAQLDNANLDVEKLIPLVDKGIISPFELKSAKSRKTAAEATLEQAKAEYENSLINLGYTKITSPVDGLLGIIPVRVGTLVSSGGEPLTTISSLGDISAYFSIDEKLLTVLRELNKDSYEKEAKEGYVELIMANGTPYSIKGFLASASGIIDRTTGSIQMKVTFPNPKTEILSGSSGVLRFPSTYSGVIAVPQNSTYELQDKIMGYIVGDDNVAKSTQLEVIGKTDNDYIVNNLKKGDKFVIGGVAKLWNGQTITPKIID